MSLRAAINNMCRHCIYDNKEAGSWRTQVEACTSADCPLYRVRACTTKGKFSAKIAAEQCLEQINLNSRLPYSHHDINRLILGQKTAILSGGHCS